MIDQNEMKKLAGEYAVRFIENDTIVGVGTGSTVKYFINQLALIKNKINGVVSSSIQTTELLKLHNIHVMDLNATDRVDIYIDGADEINSNLQMIKGGGAALTKEKIIATVSKTFICIADETKYVDRLGKFPLPIEVIPIARSYVAREILKLGGMPDWRSNIITENGNYILDVHNLNIIDANSIEEKINNITGVVSNGIFAKRIADKLVLAKKDGSIELID